MSEQIRKEDPRWIVKDMGKEGTNVNNWHWTEVPAIKWVENELKEKIKSGTIIFQNEILEIKSKGNILVGGEAFVTNRKKRVNAFYDMNVMFDFEGKIKNLDGVEIVNCEGVIKLPYVSDDNETIEDFCLEMKIKKGSDSIRKSFFKEKNCYSILQKIFDEIIDNLKKGGPMKNKSVEEMKQISKNIEKEKQKTKEDIEKKEKEQLQKLHDFSKGSSGTFNIVLKEHYRSVPVDQIFDCFMNQDRMSQYTQSKCIMDMEKKEFSHINGQITGSILKVEPMKLIEMKWRQKEWEKGVFSNVKLEFFEKEGTEVVLTQTNIPEVDAIGHENRQKIISGWKNFFLQKIKFMFGHLTKSIFM